MRSFAKLSALILLFGQTVSAAQTYKLDFTLETENGQAESGSLLTSAGQSGEFKLKTLNLKLIPTPIQQQEDLVEIKFEITGRSQTQATGKKGGSVITRLNSTAEMNNTVDGKLYYKLRVTPTIR